MSADLTSQAQTALVTGASRGIGRAIAMTLANGLNHCILRPTAGPTFRLTTWQAGHIQCGPHASETPTRSIV